MSVPSRWARTPATTARCGPAARAATGREPAGRDARAHVGAGRAGLATCAAEAREADHDAVARSTADERPAGIALAGVAPALRHARAQHGRGVVAGAVDLRTGGIGLDP